MSLELTVAYFGLVMVFITWGIDKAGLIEDNKIIKKIVGISYIAFGILLAVVFYLFVGI